MSARRALVASLIAAAVLPAPAGSAATASAPFVRFHDASARLSIAYPRGWHLRRSLTKLIYPRERLVLASYPLPRHDNEGECEPKQSLARMPADGVFLSLLEYRPQRGSVWVNLHRRDFPPLPQPFRIERDSLRPNTGCYAGPGFSLTFRAGERPFQLFVAFGPKASDTRIAEIERVLDSFAAAPLPPPPPDPYAGWPLLTDESGDSFRPPPGWPAGATLMPRKLPRPRPLFFASNLPLQGLPHAVVKSVPELPPPFPTAALDSFPPAGVLLWVVEEQPGGTDADYPAIGRGWPDGAFAAATAGPAAQWPTFSWLRAGGSFRGYRFSVWIALGPQAAPADRALALKAAASLALSGCLREPVPGRCP